MLLVLGVLASAGLSGGPGVSRAQAAGTGLLRFAHLSPDSPAVDVSVTPDPSAGNPFPHVAYGDVSPYRALPPGGYAVSVRAAGAPAGSPPVLSTTVQLTAGGARTVAAVGRFAGLRLRVLDDDLAPPAAGRARLRVVDAAWTAPGLDVALPGGQQVAGGLSPGETGSYADVPAGTLPLTVAATGRAPATVPVELAAGSVTSLLVLDAPGDAPGGAGPTVRAVLDAAGPGTVPRGSVPAGREGAAPAGRTGGSGAAALAVPALLLALRRRALRPALVAVAVAAGLVVLPSPGAAAATSSAGEPPVAARRAAPAPRAAGVAPAGPAWVAVPRLGIRGPLAPLALDASGTLTPPEDIATAGWLTQGTTPGAVGPAVVAGHVDSWRGPGVFSRLAGATAGDEVLLGRTDGTALRFVVTRVARYPKDAFPTTEVYGPTPDAELRLITCGGAFDRTARSYVDDVVVYARMVT